jgi:hypothetical protein
MKRSSDDKQNDDPQQQGERGKDTNKANNSSASSSSSSSSSSPRLSEEEQDALQRKQVSSLFRESELESFSYELYGGNGKDLELEWASSVYLWVLNELHRDFAKKTVAYRLTKRLLGQHRWPVLAVSPLPALPPFLLSFRLSCFLSSLFFSFLFFLSFVSSFLRFF